jgi:hypothetical protein
MIADAIFQISVRGRHRRGGHPAKIAEGKVSMSFRTTIAQPAFFFALSGAALAQAPPEISAHTSAPQSAR